MKTPSERSYTKPRSRWEASGQGDPDAPFSNFLHQQDSHPKVLTYLHYRLIGLDDIDCEGMASRLIRPAEASGDEGL